MAGQSRKWMILVATIWIQAFTGTNFDFSAYSSDLKSVLGISQVQLNYLAVASDLGKLFGWSSGLALMYFPLSLVLVFTALVGFIGYGLQWLVINNLIALPYFLVFLLCFLAGCSICWFNTVCFVLCIRNFTINRPLAISLTVSFNGVSAALYTLVANAIDPLSDSLYLLLNAIIPLTVSILALVPILRQPSLDPLSPQANRRDSLIFLLLNIIAIATGMYLLLLGSTASDKATAIVLLGGALFLLVFPLLVPGMVYARDWFKRTVHSSFSFESSTFLLVDIDDLELHKEFISSSRNGSLLGFDSQQPLLIPQENGNGNGNGSIGNGLSMTMTKKSSMIMGKDQLVMLGEEHSAWQLISRLDFWLYFLAYFCGGTIGLVYSNNIGQIVQSLGDSSETATIITLYASFSFFGRLLSAVPDYIRGKFYFARTGWLTIALVPTPLAFFLLASSSSGMALRAGTAMIGLSSGFIFAAAVSITSELFGPNSVGVNHNILITNIPVGSLIYGLLAAMVYDANAGTTVKSVTSDSVVCMGRGCYFQTFLSWGFISVVGLASSVLLFLRTRHAYDLFEINRIATQTPLE